MAKSEYLQREEAAKKQLGAKGVKKRVKQLPTAARASLREMTGIDISRKGVSVDPIGLAMAVSPFKLLKASKALRAAGQIDRALGVEARVASKALVGSRKAKGLYPGKGFSELTLAQKKILGSVTFKPKPLPKSTKPLNSYNSSQSTNYSLPLGLGIIGGAAVVGANAAKDNARKAAIKKASTKTRKGQTRGR